MGGDYPNDAEILHAAQIAGVDDFVKQHPEGYGLRLGERGEGLSGGYNVKELFAEIDVPLLADLPLIHKLDFNGAYRFSHYSTAAKNVGTFSAGLIYAPIKDVTFRRAPVTPAHRSIRVAPTPNDTTSPDTSRPRIVEAPGGGA